MSTFFCIIYIKALPEVLFGLIMQIQNWVAITFGQMNWTERMKKKSNIQWKMNIMEICIFFSCCPCLMMTDFCCILIMFTILGYMCLLAFVFKKEICRPKKRLFRLFVRVWDNDISTNLFSIDDHSSLLFVVIFVFVVSITFDLFFYYYRLYVLYGYV